MNLQGIPESATNQIEGDRRTSDLGHKPKTHTDIAMILYQIGTRNYTDIAVILYQIGTRNFTH